MRVFVRALVLLGVFCFEHATAREDESIFASFTTDEHEIFDIVWATDGFYVDGTIESMQAVVASQSPHSSLRFRFWVLSDPKTAERICGMWSASDCLVIDFAEIRRAATNTAHDKRCKPWAPAWPSGDVNILSYIPSKEQESAMTQVNLNPGGAQSLKKLSNMIRNWLPEFLLPFGVSRALYLDSDAFVQKSLFPLLHDGDQSFALKVVERSSPVNLLNYEHPFIKQRHKEARPKPFNAGVMLVQLERFCELDVPKTVAHILTLQATPATLWNPKSTLVQQVSMVLAVPVTEVHFVANKWNECSDTASIRHCTGNFRRAHADQTSHRLLQITHDWPRNSTVLDQLVRENKCLAGMLPKPLQAANKSIRTSSMPWSAVHPLFPDENSNLPAERAIINGPKFLECGARPSSWERSRLLAMWGDPPALGDQHSLFLITGENPYTRVSRLFSTKAEVVCTKEIRRVNFACRRDLAVFLAVVKLTNYSEMNQEVLPIAMACHTESLDYDLVFKTEHLPEENRCFTSVLWPDNEWNIHDIKEETQPKQNALTSKAIELINQLYSVDFDFFGYEKLQEAKKTGH